MWSWSTNVTDRRTDGRTTCNLNTALCTSASRSNNAVAIYGARLSATLINWHVVGHKCNVLHGDNHTVRATITNALDIAIYLSCCLTLLLSCVSCSLPNTRSDPSANSQMRSVVDYNKRSSANMVMVCMRAIYLSGLFIGQLASVRVEFDSAHVREDNVIKWGIYASRRTSYVRAARRL